MPATPKYINHISRLTNIQLQKYTSGCYVSCGGHLIDKIRLSNKRANKPKGALKNFQTNPKGPTLVGSTLPARVGRK